MEDIATIGSFFYCVKDHNIRNFGFIKFHREITKLSSPFFLKYSIIILNYMVN